MKSEELTWKDVVKDALERLGGKGHLSKINEQIEGHEKAKSRTWKATVRRTLQQYAIFYQEKPRSGVWLLRKEESAKEFDPVKYPHPRHEDVQGMLLELGRVYGYETTIPPFDCCKKFLGKPLGEIATLKVFPRFSGYPDIVKTASCIDVMWFSGETDKWIPKFAFEVEHTTDITKGLTRLLDLYRSGQRVGLFVVLPEYRLNKFRTEINRSTFSEIKNVCKVKLYDELIKLYNLALKHYSTKLQFFGE